MKKKILAIIIFLVIFSIFFYIAKEIIMFFSDGCYVVDFNDNSLSTYEQQKIIEILNSNIYSIKESDNIKITKLAYKPPIQHESKCYIFFETDIDKKVPFTLINVSEDKKEYVREHTCFDTFECEEFEFIKNTVRNNYKWWKDKKATIDYEKIDEPYTTKEKDQELINNYEILSNPKTFGKIVDITDKYIEIQTRNNDIKLIKIDGYWTNFWDYDAKDSITVFEIEKGNYYYDGMISKSREKLESIAKESKK